MTDAAQRQYVTLYRESFRPTTARVAKDVGSWADAEEIVTEAYVALYRQLEHGYDVGDQLARLNLIIANKTKNFYRWKSRHPEDPAGLVREEWFGHAPDRPFFADTFDTGVRGLPEPQRDPFILTELRGLTVREAADVLEIPSSTLEDRLQAARTYIREELHG